MGERAFSDEATATDLDAMKTELRSALRAGAMGFTTSRTLNHQTSDDRPVASRLANWEEVRALVGVTGEEGGLFEITNERCGVFRSGCAARVFRPDGIACARKSGADHVWRRVDTARTRGLEGVDGSRRTV